MSRLKPGHFYFKASCQTTARDQPIGQWSDDFMPTVDRGLSTVDPSVDECPQELSFASVPVMA